MDDGEHPAELIDFELLEEGTLWRAAWKDPFGRLAYRLDFTLEESGWVNGCLEILLGMSAEQGKPDVIGTRCTVGVHARRGHPIVRRLLPLDWGMRKATFELDPHFFERLRAYYKRRRERREALANRRA